MIPYVSTMQQMIPLLSPTFVLIQNENYIQSIANAGTDGGGVTSNAAQRRPAPTSCECRYRHLLPATRWVFTTFFLDLKVLLYVCRARGCNPPKAIFACFFLLYVCFLCFVLKTFLASGVFCCSSSVDEVLIHRKKGQIKEKAAKKRQNKEMVSNHIQKSQ